MANGSVASGYQDTMRRTGIVNVTVWQWAVFALLGAIVYSYIPRSDKAVYLFMILLGGLVFLQRNGGLNGLVQTLTNGAVSIPNAPAPASGG